MELSSKKKKISLIVIIVLASLLILGGLATGIYFGVATVPVKGVVLDEESKQPIAGVSVTDGRNVVKTNENGEFKLSGWHKARYVTITNPTGYWTEQYYQEISRSKGEYSFYLEKQKKDMTNHSFIQISDTEIHEKPDAWLDSFKKQIEELGEDEKPAFIVHTGDICGEIGLRNHIKYMSTQTMGVPVRYVIGNHDIVPYGSYGEEMFEDNYGPVNYSFDIGNIHYMVTSLAHGDALPRYNYGDVIAWVKNDLKHVDDNKKIVMFNHDVCSDETGMVMKYGLSKIELKKENVIAWLNGHLHYNFINDYDGLLNISTAPFCGGIDGSIGGSRTVKIEGDKIVDTYMNYTDYEPQETEKGYAWQTALSGRNLYTNPQYVDGKIYVGVMDNDMHSEDGKLVRHPVFACINPTDGSVEWKFEVATSIKNDFYIYDGVAVVQDASGIVYGLDIKNSTKDNVKKLWEHDMELVTYRYSMTGITGEGNRVYCGNSRFVYCFDVKTGNKIWRANYGKGEPSPFKYQIMGDKLIVGDHWRAHYALDKNTGKRLWKIKSWISATSTAFEYNGYIYFLRNETICKIDPKNGKFLINEQPITSKIGGEEHDYDFETGSKPVLDGNIAYIATNDYGVIAVNIDTLEVLWECKTGENMVYATPYSRKGSAGVQAAVTIVGDKLYFGAMDGYLYVINKADGKLVGDEQNSKFYLGNPVLSSVIVAKIDNIDCVIVSDFGGSVTRINLNTDGAFAKQI